MVLVKKDTIFLKKYKIKRIYFLGNLIYECLKVERYNQKLNKKKTYKFHSLKSFTEKPKNTRIFYLKVHRLHKTSFDCIRQWANIAHKMNAFIYFVCDNPEMEEKIKLLRLPNRNFSFIKSDKKTLKSTIKGILHGVERQKLWERIAFSMTTPFVHAAQNNYNISYNIDADDILLCAEPEKISEAFLKAEKHALENNLDVFNIDMFYSKSYGVHWSFGAVLCTNPQKCIDVMKSNTNWRQNKELIEKYNICWIDKFNFNVDWLFTYLRDTKQLRMGTFYIENAVVTHMPDYVLEHGWAFMIQWQDNQIHFPIVRNLYQKQIWDTAPIPQDCVKIDVNIAENDYKKFFKKFFDVGVSFELQMLNYAQARHIISKDVYDRYAQTPEFIKENQFQQKLLAHKKAK